MGQTRRAHRKSRAGCDECKRRRIKCGEEKPSCAHCVRHLVNCVYPSNAPGSVKRSPASRLSATTPVATPPRQGSIPSDPYPTSYLSNVAADESLYTLSDLALLHHWTLVTSPNIVQSPSVDYIWQTAFPQFAFTNGALMSRILSIAALHRAYLEPASRHSAMLVAGQHHSRAITGLMNSLQDNIEPACGNAIFVNATLTFFYAFISFGPLFNNEYTIAAAHTSRVLGASWIHLIRGLGPVIEPIVDQVRAGPLCTLLDINKCMELQPDTASDEDDRLIDRTKELWGQGNYSNEEKDTYNKALLALRQCNMWMKQSEAWYDDHQPRKANYGPWSGPFIWVSVTPEAFFKLLEQRQVPAMIIYACFGALIHRLNYCWWMEGCGKSIVEVVDQCLGPFWSGWLDWANKVVQSDSQS